MGRHDLVAVATSGVPVPTGDAQLVQSDGQNCRNALVVSVITGAPHTSDLIETAVEVARDRCDETADAEAKACRDMARAEEATDLEAAAAVCREARAKKLQAERALAEVRRYARRSACRTRPSQTTRALAGLVRRHHRGRAPRTSQRRSERLSIRVGSRDRPRDADPHEHLAALAGGAR